MNDIGVVGVGTVVKRSFILAVISALYALEDVSAERRAGLSSTGGSFIIGV